MASVKSILKVSMSFGFLQGCEGDSDLFCGGFESFVKNARSLEQYVREECARSPDSMALYSKYMQNADMINAFREIGDATSFLAGRREKDVISLCDKYVGELRTLISVAKESGHIPAS